jgi:hypothetical protein
MRDEVMKTALLIAAAVLGLASSGAADLAGSSVSLLAPEGPIDPLPPQAIRCRFAVTKDSLSSESVVGVWLQFPEELRPLEWTMDFDEIEEGRPDFSGTVEDHWAIWAENDPEAGGIHFGEQTEIGIYVVPDVLLPPGVELTICWWLVGELGNDLSGQLHVHTPVEEGSWGAIKGRFRIDGRRGPPN